MTDNTYQIEIRLSEQKLFLKADEKAIRDYIISTAKNGPGEMMDSECTPCGGHIIAEKIGEGCESGTVFIGRKPTGEIYSPKLRQESPGRDWILTRIIWLKGTEPGKNQGGEVDSYERYIYIHGSPDDVEMGVPRSRGCVRMRNSDVIELYDLIQEGTAVTITG